MSDHEHIKEILPAYALGSVTTEEADDLRTHLDDCDDCDQALRTYLTTAAALGGDQAPPAGVWDRILAEIDTTGQVATVTDLGERRVRRGFSLLAGVAAAVALVFAGFIVARLSDRSPLADESVIAAAEDAARQEGSIVTEFIVDNVAVARLVLTEDGRGFVIPSEGLTALEESRTYQLWVINTEEAVISAGVLGSDPAPAPFTWTGDVAGLALTREVAGGVVSSEGDVVSVITDL